MTFGRRRSADSIAAPVACLVAVLIVLACSPPGQQTAPTRPSAAGTGNRVAWMGGSWYLNGVNYPWSEYGRDFGTNDWGSVGVHDSETRAKVDADFAAMERQGIHSVRWWVFSDGRAGITWDSRGLPSGIDQYVFPDMDSALALAQKHHIYLDLVLTDFTLMYDASQENGVQLGGRSQVIDTGSGQQALINNVFKPLFQRYARSQQILAYEVMNEPEWGIQDDGAVDSKINHPTSLENFRRLTRDVATAVHANTRSYVTLGSAAKRWTEQWKGLGLDFYSVHYYEENRLSLDSDLYDTDARALNLDAPVVIGEYPLGSKKAGFAQYLDNWFSRGYAGAWAWSFKAVDEFGSPDARVMRDWNSRHLSATGIAVSSAASSPSPGPS